jgi:hypothetical protein
VELEAHTGTGLHVLDAGQEEGGDDLAIAGSLTNFLGHFFEQLFARRFFKQADERLDVVGELDDFGIGFRFLGGDSWQLAQESELRSACERGGGSSGGEELAAIGRQRHSAALR